MLYIIHLTLSKWINWFDTSPSFWECYSQNIPQVTQPPNHLRRWTKDHPFDNIVGNPSRPVSTRKQLASDALWCCFHTELSKVEPRTFQNGRLSSVTCTRILGRRKAIDFEESFSPIARKALLSAKPCTKGVNTMAEQNVPAQAPTRTDEQIVPRSQWLQIGKSNLLFDAQKIQKNPHLLDICVLGTLMNLSLLVISPEVVDAILLGPTTTTPVKPTKPPSSKQTKSPTQKPSKHKLPQKVRKGKPSFQLVDEDDEAQQESVPQEEGDDPALELAKKMSLDAHQEKGVRHLLEAIVNQGSQYLKTTPKLAEVSGMGVRLLRDQTPHDSTTGLSSQPEDNTSGMGSSFITVTSGVGDICSYKDQAGSAMEITLRALAGPDHEPMLED
ncbi:hypothetical protein Tco_0189168 [Tanacetum coccineum]